MWEINKLLMKKIEENNITVEYTSLYNSTSTYSALLLKEKKYIIVPKEPEIVDISCQWNVAHELGHFLVNEEKGYDPFKISKYDQEKRAWEFGKNLLEECSIPLKEEGKNYYLTMESNLSSYEPFKSSTVAMFHSLPMNAKTNRQKTLHFF